MPKNVTLKFNPAPEPKPEEKREVKIKIDPITPLQTVVLKKRDRKRMFGNNA